MHVDYLGVADWYFNIASSSSMNTGIVLGNLKWAEDTVLSYASVLKNASNNRRLSYVPSAICIF